MFFKNYLKYKIDNKLFQLHYIFTVILLIFTSVLLTVKIYFGETIDCDTSLQLKSVVSTLCWKNGTHSPDSERGTFKGSPMENQSGSFTKQINYELICFVFLLQAFCFFLPRYFWQHLENGQLSSFSIELSELMKGSPEAKKELVDLYFLRANNKLYALKYAFCEWLNFINILVQFALLNWQISGDFEISGAIGEFFEDSSWMKKSFPALIKCRYTQIGASGALQQHETWCALPMNFFNEKLFFCLWIWFLILLVLSLSQIIYRVFYFAWFSLPRKLKKTLNSFSAGFYKESFHLKTNAFTFGDYFFMHLFYNHLETKHFRQFVAEINDVLSKKEDVEFENIF